MNIMPNVNFKKGEVIFREGDQADGIYYICSGRVKVTRTVGEQPMTLAELEEGDIFGELAIIDRRPRAATIVALEDTWVYKFSGQVFEKKLEEMDQLMRTMIVTLVLTIRNMNIKQEKLLEKWGYPRPDDEQLAGRPSIQSNI
jgi:CRP-like cAMP-binding protein